MSEFPKQKLRDLARHGFGSDFASGERAIFQAIDAYEQLSERCVMDRTRDSAEIGRLRAAIARLSDRLSEMIDDVGDDE